MVTWRGKKQLIVSRSNAEVEFREITIGTCKVMRLKRLLSELKLSSNKSICMLCDNQGVIRTAKNPAHHNHTKHIEVDHHFIKETMSLMSYHFLILLLVIK